MVEDPVVTLVPALEAAMNVGLGRAGLEAHERVREQVAGPVELRREIIAFGLSLAAEQGGLLLVLVHVVGNRPEIVEKLAVDGPALVGIPEIAADDLGTEDFDRVLEREPASVVDHVAQSFVGGCSLVGGGRRGSKPALVDSPAVCSEGIEVFACQLEPAAGHQERPRHPGRGQPQDTLAGIERRAHLRGEIVLAHPHPSLYDVRFPHLAR